MKYRSYILFFLFTLAVASTSCAHKKSVSAANNTDNRQSQLFLYHFYNAQDKAAQQDYKTAFAEYLFCLQLDSLDAASNKGAADFYSVLEEKEIAQRMYKRAFDTDPYYYWMNYTNLLLQTEQTELATSVLEQTHKLYPRNTEVLETLSNIYATDSKTLKKALAIQDKIEEIEGINAYNAHTRYDICMKMGNYTKAMQAVDRYLKENPDDLKFPVMKAQVYLVQNKPQEAVSSLKTELRKHPDNIYANLWVANYYHRLAQDSLATAYVVQAVKNSTADTEGKLQIITSSEDILKDKPETKIALYELIAKENPQNIRPLYALGNHYIEAENYPLAKHYFEQAIQIDSTDNNSWRMLFSIVLQDSLTTNEDAAKIIEQAFRNVPNDIYWYYWEAQSLVLRNELDSALMVAVAAYDMPGEARIRNAIYTLAGDIYLNQKDYDNCFDAYERALAINPENIMVLNNYAYSLSISGGDLKKAEKMSQKTIEAEPNNATFLDTYAWILYLQGQELLAKFYIKKAMENASSEEISGEVQDHYNTIFGIQNADK